MKIASFNCRGIGKKLKRKSIFKECLKYDVTCLQETFVTYKKSEEWKLEWKSEFYHVEGSSNSQGLIVLTKKKMKEGTIQLITRKERLLCLKLDCDDLSFYILNIYAPNFKKEKILFFNELYSILDRLSNECLFICRDFNMVYDNSRDIIAGQPHDVEVVAEFRKWINNFNLIDTWRLKNSQDIDFTYSTPTPFVARRLDYIFTSEPMAYSIENSIHVISSLSDQKIVATTFSTN